MSSNIRYVVVTYNNVGLAYGSSNITEHNHKIYNVGLHLVQQMHIIIPVTEIKQSDWLTSIQHFVMLDPSDVICFLLSLAKRKK